MMKKWTENQIVVAVVTLLIVALCAFALGKRAGLRQKSWQAAVAAHHAAVNHCRALGDEADRRIKMAWRAHMPIPEFEEHFGKLVPVDQGDFPNANDDTTHVYTHAPSHRVFYLRFEEGKLVGHRSNHGADDIQPYLPSIEDRLASMK
jgi:hypothetical protein